MNAVAAATGIKKKAEKEGRGEAMQAMSTSASALPMLEPAAAAATRTKTQQPPPRPQPQPQPRASCRGGDGGGIIRAHRPSPPRRPVSARATGAAAAADFPSSASGTPSPPLLPEEIAARLDHAPPALSALDFAVAVLASALAFTLTSALMHLRREGAARAAAAFPFSLASLSLLPLLAAAAAFALALSAARERAFASRAFSARELADPDSRFAELLGVEVHYKVARPKPVDDFERDSNPVRFSIAAMHGFGAAAFSWSLVARPLADRLSASFTKHDMPGFGLTERPSKMGLAPYSLAFNGKLARAVADLELEREREKSSAPAPLRVLMGHSLGAVCAAAEAARDPGAVDALVMVAPAIVASNGKKGSRRRGGAAPEDTKKPKSAFSTLPMRLLSATALLFSSLATLLAGWTARALIVLSWPFLVFLLRMAVRSFQFWENGLSAALGGGSGGKGVGRGVGSPSASPSLEAEEATEQTTPAGIPLWLSQRYRLPSLVRGWETGFLLFLLARVPVASGGFFPALARAAGDAWRVLHGKSSSSSSSISSSPLTSGPPAARLAAAVRGGRVPLLIIHGDRDALVPLANSARLVEQLSGDFDGDFGEERENGASSSAPLCELVVLRNRGHTPQEEAPREFVEAVAAFLERVERERKEKK